MFESRDLPRLMARLVTLAGLVGAVIGLGLGWANGDALGWVVLRIAALAVAFALVARRLLSLALRGFLTTRFEQLVREHEQKQRKAAA